MRNSIKQRVGPYMSSNESLMYKKVTELHEQALDIEENSCKLFCELLIKLMKHKGVKENEVMLVPRPVADSHLKFIMYRVYYEKKSLVFRYMCNDFEEGFYDARSDEVSLSYSSLYNLFRYLTGQECYDNLELFDKFCGS